ncbi:zinc finger and SCAN domain-containing protein 2-like [Cheilinus undulatus]|uniref:zinc finger and SCAN domain-containing protein 2-like n=1 Tax=Cheilinus undulatus TaxID=241271 RepID=UPI001BD3354E|nr:zinc finger and SCAN domain-containing protein 2-like [Cheilinus undulatus]
MEQFNPPSPLILTGNLAENWRRWERRFGLYIVSSGANEEEEDVKKAILLHSIGEDAREVFNTLTVSSAGENATMEDILEAFREYCSPLSKDIKQLVMKDEEVLSEQQERSSSLKQEETPEPAHIKEEQEELWISQKKDQLPGAEEASINVFTVTPVTVKSEEEVEEKPQTLQLHENQSEENRGTEHLKTEFDGDDCGGSGANRDLNPDIHLQSVMPDKTSHLSGSETDDSADWEESDEPQEGLSHLQNKDRGVSDLKCNTGDTSESSSERAPSFGQKKQHKQKGTRTKKKLFHCSVCGNGYPSKKNLKEHMLRHATEKRFSCSVCQKSFIWKAEVVMHMRVHTGEKPFSCSICGKSFSRHGNLSRHSVVHTGEKPFSCSVCGNSFSQLQHLRAHSIAHTGEKPFSCAVCGKSFSRHGSLWAHSVVHTEEKPFSCSVCGVSFSRHGSLRRHSVVHTEKWCSCSVCGEKFTSQHVKKHKCTCKSSKDSITFQDGHQM